MEIIEISDIRSDELRIYTSLTETQLKQYRDFEKGVFIAESPKVIRVALKHGYEPISLLCERKHITGDASEIIESCPNIKVYSGDREVLASLTGYTLTRGVLCAMKRKPLPQLEPIVENAKLVCVIQGICDTTNIGSIFRSASALGVEAIVLSSDSCDPLNRRAVRVSMGTVFTVPWTIIHDPMNALKELGFSTAALALRDDSYSLDAPVLKSIPKLAVIFGTEGEGLPNRIIEKADYVVKIPMSHGVDSLNVGSAAAVTFWELRR